MFHERDTLRVRKLLGGSLRDSREGADAKGGVPLVDSLLELFGGCYIVHYWASIIATAGMPLRSRTIEGIGSCWRTSCTILQCNHYGTRKAIRYYGQSFLITSIR